MFCAIRFAIVRSGWLGILANAITGFLSSLGVAVADLQVTGVLVHAGTESGAENAMLSQSQLTEATTNLGSLGAGTVLSLADLGNANAAWVFEMPSALAGATRAGSSRLKRGMGLPRALSTNPPTTGRTTSACTAPNARRCWECCSVGKPFVQTSSSSWIGVENTNCRDRV